MRRNGLIIMLLTSALLASCAARPAQRAERDALPAPETSYGVVLASAAGEEPAAQPAQPATQPAQPALPAGHPDISAMMSGASQAPATQPALPAGHPDISALMGGGAGPSTQPALPAGHPDISGMGGAGGATGAATGANQPPLPAGHPDISQMMGGAAPGAMPRATETTSLTVKAVQATAGGPASLGAISAAVEVYDRNSAVAKIDATLNERGEVTVSGIPVGPTFQPLVTVTYKGVSYQGIGQPIASKAPQTVTVPVYEPTEQPVAWDVRMRHMMLQPTSNGVQVIDMLAIDNATDRAFIGSPDSESADGRRMTFALPIPANARDVKLVGGFHDCCSMVSNGYVINTMAIVPGTTQYQLSYFVPQTDGTAEVTASAPALTKSFIAMAPDDGTTIAATGLESGTSNMGSGVTRFFKATSVPADQVVKIRVSGAPTKAVPGPGMGGMGGMRGDASRGAGSAAATPVAAAASLDSAKLAKTIAGLGGLLIFLIGGALFFRRPASNLSEKSANRSEP